MAEDEVKARGSGKEAEEVRKPRQSRRPPNLRHRILFKKVREFFYEEYYLKEYPKKRADKNGNQVDVWDVMGFFVAGFSSTCDHPEVWEVQIDAAGKCPNPKCVFDKTTHGTAAWSGMPEALNRLILGVSSQVRAFLIKSGIPEPVVDKLIQSLPVEPLVASAMPLQDAIDLVKFMVEVTIGFVRFAPGPPTVAEPIDVAAITKHEGFRWVRRKHYFSSELNPPSQAPTEVEGEA